MPVARPISSQTKNLHIRNRADAASALDPKYHQKDHAIESQSTFKEADAVQPHGELRFIECPCFDFAWTWINRRDC